MNSQPQLAVLRSQLQQQVFRQGIHLSQNPYSKKVFEQLTQCHTASMGVHLNRCTDADCGHQQYQYHNCGNRHCPNCGGLKREQWLEHKKSELLPTAYYHVVFTLPHEFNSLIMGNRKAMFKLLFDASSHTLLTLSKDEKWLGATPGIISILHTWGQDLSFHPHVHCIVSGGGISGKEWVSEKRKNNAYLFPQKAMQTIYKAYFLKRLRLLISNNEVRPSPEADMEKIIRTAGYKKWNVYAKRPFGGALQVLEYLGRYTHKVAITTHRILEIDAKKNSIRFKYKNYHARGTDNMHQERSIPIPEFVRLFEQHILPKGFVKIRHYGYLRNHDRSNRLKQLFSQMHLPPPPPKLTVPVATLMMEKHGVDLALCPKCKTNKMETVATYRRGILCAIVASKADYQPSIAAKNKDSPNP